MPDATIFDVDGVLVDSYDAHFQSWQRLAQETGTTFTEEQFAESFGRTSRDIVRAHWPEARANEARVDALDHRKEQWYREIVRDDFPVMDGARELIIALLKDGFRLAIGSSGPRENVELAVEHIGIPNAFAAIVTGEDVSRGKPDPEVFLTAAKRMHAEPRDCAVIEDAPVGIMAAHAAGMAAVALLSRGRRPEQFTADPPEIMVKSLRELSPAQLRQLIQRHQRA